MRRFCFYNVTEKEILRKRRTPQAIDEATLIKNVIKEWYKYKHLTTENTSYVRCWMNLTSNPSESTYNSRPTEVYGCSLYLTCSVCTCTGVFPSQIRMYCYVWIELRCSTFYLRTGLTTERSGVCCQYRKNENNIMSWPQKLCMYVSGVTKGRAQGINPPSPRAIKSFSKIYIIS